MPTRLPWRFFGLAECALPNAVGDCGEPRQYRLKSGICANTRYEGGGGRFGDCPCTVYRVIFGNSTFLPKL